MQFGGTGSALQQGWLACKPCLRWGWVTCRGRNGFQGSGNMQCRLGAASALHWAWRGVHAVQARAGQVQESGAVCVPPAVPTTLTGSPRAAAMARHATPAASVPDSSVFGMGSRGGGMSASASASASTPRQGSVAASAHAACCGHPSATAKLRGSGHMAATSGPPALARANPKHAARERRCAERVVREGACMHACRSIHRSNQLQRSGGHTQPAHWDARVRVRACACA